MNKTKKLYFSNFKNGSVIVTFLSIFLLAIDSLLFGLKNNWSLIFLWTTFFISTWWVYMHLYLMTKVSLKVVLMESSLNKLIRANPNGLTLRQIAKATNLSSLEAFVFVDLPTTSGFEISENKLSYRRPFNKRTYRIRKES